MKLHWYFARKFLWYFFGLTFAFFVIFVLVDLIEQAGRFESSNTSFHNIVGLTLLKSPEGLYIIMPLIMVLSALVLFLAISRSSELVIVRAAGRSALVTLVSPFLLSLLIGVLLITVFNPIVAATTKRFDALVAEYSSSDRDVFSISDKGLWLRQGNETGQTVIQARGANWDGSVLYDVTFISFVKNGSPIRRIEAKSARLESGYWKLTNAKSWPLLSGVNPERSATDFATLRVPSSLTRESLSDSLGRPSLVPLWDLPAHIADLENAGFSARRFSVWFQMELARPVFLASMVLIGAGFSMRHQRGGQTGLMVLMAIVFAFGLYFIRNFAQILGENGQIPVLLAAWAPPFVGILASLGLILHLEDG